VALGITAIAIEGPRLSSDGRAHRVGTRTSRGRPRPCHPQQGDRPRSAVQALMGVVLLSVPPAVRSRACSAAAGAAVSGEDFD